MRLGFLHLQVKKFHKDIQRHCARKAPRQRTDTKTCTNGSISIEAAITNCYHCFSGIICQSKQIPIIKQLLKILQKHGVVCESTLSWVGLASTFVKPFILSSWWGWDSLNTASILRPASLTYPATLALFKRQTRCSKIFFRHKRCQELWKTTLTTKTYGNFRKIHFCKEIYENFFLFWKIPYTGFYALISILSLTMNFIAILLP